MRQQEYFNINMGLTFVDPCIIVQFIRKIQQNAAMYQNLYYSIFI